MSTSISRRGFLAGSALSGLMLGMPVDQAKESTLPFKWDFEADVVVIGAGAVGLPAAIGARDAGLSVLVVDTNYNIGGHAIVSGGNVPLGGGTSFQKKYGIKDDPETLFKDLTDWSVVESGGAPEYRYNDRAVQHALAQNEAQTFEFLLANGVKFVDKVPDNSGAHAVGISARREHHCVWSEGQSAESPAGAGGTDLIRGLEASVRAKGVKFLLNYHMDELFREPEGDRPVIGLKAHYTPTMLPGSTAPLASFRSEGNVASTAETITVHAKKAVVIATGGNSGNVEFRRIFDPRTNYIRWTAKSPLFPKIGFTGLNMRDWQDAIIVNQTGRRFYNELENGYPNGSHEGFFKDGKPYVYGDCRNATRNPFKPRNYIDAALAITEGSVGPDFSAGPQWAIFDAAAMKRERMRVKENTCDPTSSSLPIRLKNSQKRSTPPRGRSRR